MELNFDFGEKKEPEKAEIVEKTPFDHFDLEKAKVNFAVFEEQLTQMRNKAEELKILDDAKLETAMQMIVQCKTIIKRAEDAKEALPAFKVAKQFKLGVDKFIRERLKKPITILEGIIKPKINSYQQAQAELERKIQQKKAEEEAAKAKEEAERIQKEAEEKHQKELEEAKALQEDLDKKADEAKVDRVTVPIPEKQEEETIIAPAAPVIEKTDKIKTDTGTAKVEATWICEVIYPNLVPKEYCSPDQKLLDLAVKHGEREIAGCKIHETFETKVRLSHKQQQPDLYSEEDDDIKF